MKKHTITGRELLNLLTVFSPEHYPEGITEDPSTRSMLLGGVEITDTELVDVWSCTGDHPVHRLDSDWSVERN